MPIIAALVGIVLGAIAAIAYMRTAKQGSLHEADEKIQSAHAQAESLIGDAKRQARPSKKRLCSRLKRRSSRTSRPPRPRTSSVRTRFVRSRTA